MRAGRKLLCAGLAVLAATSMAMGARAQIVVAEPPHLSLPPPVPGTAPAPTPTAEGVTPLTPPQNGAPPTPAPAQRTPEQIAAANAATLLDWPALARYRAEDAALPPPEPGKPRVVLLGDSITQYWLRERPGFFAANGYVDRGISGQTSPQMVLRFHQDVVALKPAVVMILAGTNDIAQNTGPITDEEVIANLEAMVEMARAHRIKVVIGSVPPATTFFWRPDVQPAPHVMALNEKIKAWAKMEDLTYADFWSAMALPDGTMNPQLANDTVHPNLAGYTVMEPIATSAIATAMKLRR
jgi:lysophospholipase L1-like esterase